jgi:hypothetical protein
VYKLDVSNLNRKILNQISDKNHDVFYLYREFF